MPRFTKSFLLLLVAIPLLGTLSPCDDEDSDDDGGGGGATTCSTGLDGTYTFWLEAASGDYNCTGTVTRATVVISGGMITFDSFIGTFPISGGTASATWTEDWTAGGVQTVGTFTIVVDTTNCTLTGSGSFVKNFTGGSSCSGNMTITGEKTS